MHHNKDITTLSDSTTQANLTGELEVESHTEDVKVRAGLYGNTRRDQVTVEGVNWYYGLGLVTVQ